MYRRMTSWISLIVLVALVFGSGYWLGRHEQPTPPAAAQDDSSTEELFAPFWEAWNLLHSNYVDPLDDNVLMEGALSGMMSAIGDRHTDYMPPQRYTQAQESLSGNYEGIGASVSQDPDTGALVIVRPFPGSPAETAGLRQGDQIVTVDGEDVTELDQSIIIGMVKGPAGTQVELGIRRAGSEELLIIPVTRAQIVTPTVDYEVFDGEIGYVLLTSFSDNSDEEVLEALIDMNANNLNGLIIDLRGNTGGYLDTTLQLMSMFISEGTIFIERGANGAEEKVQAYGNPIAPTVPMVILVDGFSASASELFSGTMQDYKRAVILGTPTFGKGSVQTWRGLSNGGGIRITISRWFTPKDRSVEPDGIQPDIELEYVPLEEGQVYDRATDNQIQAAIEQIRRMNSPQAAVPAGQS